MTESVVSNNITVSYQKYTPKIDCPLKVLFNLCDKLSIQFGPEKPIFYAFGGWVRDCILGEKPVDLDFYISNSGLANKVIEYLEGTGRISGKVRYTSQYDNFSTQRLTYVSNCGEKIQVDLVSKSTGKQTTKCDFTCNNLVMYSDETIGYRVPHPDSGFPGSQWTFQCIQDVLKKRLVFIANNEDLRIEDKFRFSWKMEERLQKMLDKGYSNTHISLSKSKMFYPRTHLDVDEGHEVSESCSICSEKYLFNCSECRTVMLKCGHDFHFSCISIWTMIKGKETCPVCRQEIIYALK